MTVSKEQEGDLKFNVSQMQVTEVMFLLRARISLATVSRHQQTVNQLHNNWVCQTILSTMMDRMGRITILHTAILKAINLNSIVGQIQVHVPQVTSAYVWQVAKIMD